MICDQPFEDYFADIQKRNAETHEDGHLIVFNYTNSTLELRKEYFRDCWKNSLSPYKALTYLELNNDEQRYGD